MEPQGALKVGSQWFNESVGMFDRFDPISRLYRIPIASRVIEWTRIDTCGFHRLVVRTFDSESINPSSSLGGTLECFDGWIPWVKLMCCNVRSFESYFNLISHFYRLRVSCSSSYDIGL